MKRPCIIFDLDGTLADTKMPIMPIQHMVQLHNCLVARLPVFICCNRPETHRIVVIEWLWRYSIMFHRLMIRQADDIRSEAKVKKQMLDEIRGLGFEPAFAVDDSLDVARMFQSNRVPCLLVHTTWEYLEANDDEEDVSGACGSGSVDRESV